MKKSYLMMAAAATMLAACTQTDFVNEVPAEAPKAIKFDGGFVNKTTRSENNTTEYSNNFSDFHQNFSVWGYKKIQSNYVQVFNEKEVVVEKTAGGESFTYDGLVAWDNAASAYYFYAAAPKNHTWDIDDTDPSNLTFATTVNLTGTNVNKDKSTHTLVLESPDNSKDLLIAAPTNAVKFQDVQFNFIHILSRLNIRVQRPSDLTRDMHIYSVAVKNLYVDGNFNEAAAAANQSGTYDRWEIPSGASKDNNTYTSSFTDLPKGYLTVALGADCNVMQALVVPQPARFEDIAVDGSNASACQEPYLIIEYGLANESVSGGIEKFKQYYNLAAAFGITSGNELPFHEGWENTLTITVNSRAIGFTSKVSSWSTHNGTHILQ